MSTPTVAEIAAFLEARKDASGTLVLARSTLPAAWTNLAAALATTGLDATLRVSGAQVTMTATSVAVAGTGAGVLAGLAVSGSFAPKGDQVTAVVTGTSAPAGWTLDQAFPSLGQTVLSRLPAEAGARLVFRSDADGASPAGLAFDGRVNVLPALGERATKLPVGIPFAFSGEISAAAGPPDFALAAPLGSKLDLGRYGSLTAHVVLASQPLAVQDADGKPGWAPVGSASLASTLSFNAGSKTYELPIAMRLVPAFLEVSVDTSHVATVSLTDLATWAGASFAAGLPDPSSYTPSASLALKDVTLVLDPAAAALVETRFLVGSTSPWTLVPGYIELSGLDLLLTIDASGVRGLLGGVFVLRNPRTQAIVAQVAVSAAAPGLTFQGTLVTPPPLELDALVQVFLPDAVVPAIELDSFSCMLQPKTGTLQVEAALKTDWTIPLGPTGIKLTDASLALERTPGAESGHDTTLTVYAAAKIGESITFDATYNLPADFQLRGTTPTAKLAGLVAGLLGQEKALAGIDYDLGATTLLIEHSSGVTHALVAAQIANVGSIAVDFQDVAGQIGFAAGVDLSLGKLASVPVFGDQLGIFQAKLSLERIVLVVSSVNRPLLDFDMSVFEAPTITAKRIATPAGAPAVNEGVSVYALLSLDGEGILDKLRKKLHVDSLTFPFAIQIDLENVGNIRGSFSIRGAFDVDTKCFSLAATVWVAFRDDEVLAAIEGRLEVTIRGTPLDFTVTGLIDDNGIDVSGSIVGAPWQNAFGIHGLTLADFSAELGSDWEFVPTVGLGGTIGWKELIGSFAVLFDSNMPTKCLLAASITRATLRQVLDAVEGPQPPQLDAVLEHVVFQGTPLFIADASLAAALDDGAMTPAIAAGLAKGQGGGIQIPGDPRSVLLIVTKKGESWHLTDRTTLKQYSIAKTAAGLQVSLDPQLLVVPDAPTSIGQTPETQFQQSELRLAGTIVAFGVSGSLSLDLALESGFTGTGSISGFAIGSYFKLAGADGKGDPSFSIGTFGGGASANAGLHATISGSAYVLGKAGVSLDLELSDAGFTWHQDVKVFDRFVATVSATAGLGALASAEFALDATMKQDLFDYLDGHGSDGLKKLVDAANAQVALARKAADQAQQLVDAARNAVKTTRDSVRESAERRLSAARDNARSLSDAAGNAASSLEDVVKALLDPPKNPFKLKSWLDGMHRKRDDLKAALGRAKDASARAAQEVTRCEGALGAAAIDQSQEVVRALGVLRDRTKRAADLTGDLDAVERSGQSLLALGRWIATNGLKNLVNVKGAHFKSTLSATSVTGSVQMEIDVQVAAAAQKHLTVDFDFKDAEKTVERWVTALKGIVG